MATRPPPKHHSAFAKRISRAHSPFLARGMPWLSVMVGSLITQWLSIASAPILPPFGFMILLSWRQLRPGLLPVWAGLPLGLFDDLYSGQPIGSAIVLWSASLIVMEVVEANFPWRSLLSDWLAGSVIITLYVIASLGLANLAGGHVLIMAIIPQVLLSPLLYPLVGRMVATLDHLRLVRFRTLR